MLAGLSSSESLLLDEAGFLTGCWAGLVVGIALTGAFFFASSSDESLSDDESFFFLFVTLAGGGGTAAKKQEQWEWIIYI